LNYSASYRHYAHLILYARQHASCYRSSTCACRLTLFRFLKDEVRHVLWRWGLESLAAPTATVNGIYFQFPFNWPIFCDQKLGRVLQETSTECCSRLDAIPAASPTVSKHSTVTGTTSPNQIQRASLHSQPQVVNKNDVEHCPWLQCTVCLWKIRKQHIVHTFITQTQSSVRNTCRVLHNGPQHSAVQYYLFTYNVVLKFLEMLEKIIGSKQTITARHPPTPAYRTVYTLFQYTVIGLEETQTAHPRWQLSRCDISRIICGTPTT